MILMVVVVLLLFFSFIIQVVGFSRVIMFPRGFDRASSLGLILGLDLG